MTLLVIGLVLFLAVHAFSMARDAREAAVARLGVGGYRAVYSVVSILGLGLIVWGYGVYRAGGYIPVWDPPVALRHLALLLLAPVFPLLSVGRNSLIRAKTRHPMLLAIKIWAFAHLLANGDFGSILAWAVVARISVKSRETGASAVPPAANWTTSDTIAVVAGLAFYLLVVFWLHDWLIGVPVLTK